MTHRPETAYRAYAAKNRRADAMTSVRQMQAVMYGGEAETTGDAPENEDQVTESHQEYESTVPSSAGALHRRQRTVKQRRLDSAEAAAIDKEARRLRNTNGTVSTHGVRNSWQSGSRCLMKDLHERWSISSGLR